MIALIEAHKAGLFKKPHIVNNIVAGIIVGIVALPLSMAFAIASGAKPEQGLYTAIVACFFGSILGGSRVQISGPAGAFIAILAGITAQYGVEGLQVATFMAGIMMLVLGFLRLGSVIKFIPSPVIIGFTAGIGVIIWTSQWKDFFGLKPVGTAHHFHEKMMLLFNALPTLHLPTTLLAITSLLLVLFTPKVLPKIPGPLVAMVAATVLQSIYHFDGVATIGSTFGGIPQALPSFQWLPLSWERCSELVGPAFAIAMLGAIESLLCAVVADGMTGVKHDSNQELIGQGAANLLAPLFGGFAATGTIARTATNIRNGGTSPLAGLVHVLTLVLIILLLAPTAANIPLCALAAILFVVAYNMSDIPHVYKMITHAPRTDVAILCITLFLTVFTDLVVAVNVGVLLATLLFMRRMARSFSVEEVAQEDLVHALKEAGLENVPAGTMVYSVDGPFFFGAAENFERALQITHTEPKALIIRLGRVPFIDATGLQTLEEVITGLQKRGTKVILCEAIPMLRGKLERARIITKVGQENVVETLAEALKKGE